MYLSCVVVCLTHVCKCPPCLRHGYLGSPWKIQPLELSSSQWTSRSHLWGPQEEMEEVEEG